MKHWSRRGAVAWLLWPASLVFWVVAVIRRFLYRIRILGSEHPGIPVIVVGNLTAGGSGKTPLALHIAELLREHKWKPGIVSRGYLGGARAAAERDSPKEANIASDPAEVGDEPILLARRSGCPVWVAPARSAACRALRAQHPECDVIVTDDGLQHYALARDIEICVVDGRGFGNGFLLPAGPLREPPSRLRSVDAVVLHQVLEWTGPEVQRFAMRLDGEKFVRITDAHDVRAAKSFAGNVVHAVAGIGDPERFFRHLAGFGLNVVPHPFPDHHPFVAGDLDFGDQAPVVMTEKDAVKCRRLAKPNHWVFPVSASLDPAFERWLLEKLSGSKAA